jgi:membrane protein YdbS with pleckstrin-like domain
MEYKAKTDWLVGVSMLVGIAAPAFIAVTQNLPWMSLASVVAAAFVFGISYPQRYETGPDALTIKAGLTTRLIPYTKIKGVKPSNDGRLAIDYGIGNLLIAPQDISEFMEDIARHAPQLARRGQELVLASSAS